jgi:hypothetical protein
MKPWGVLVWNMALMSPGARSAEENMGYLSQLVEHYSIKVALLNEASVYHLKKANAKAVGDGRPKPFAFSEQGTKGRDFWTDEEGVRKPYNRKRWSAAVMSPLGPTVLGENDVRATSSYAAHRRRPDIPFTNSRPGSWIAATVAVGTEKVTCVSLYGLIEELTDASMHRSLSEISPIFSDPRHNGLVLLGGDFNTITASDGSVSERDRIVLDRIWAYGLVDCLAERRDENAVPAPTNPDSEDKPRGYTLTRLIPNKAGEHIPRQDRRHLQVDYLFASQGLADRLDAVIEISPDEWERYSDHRPIIAMFRAGPAEGGVRQP